MFPAASLLTALFLAISIAASPVEVSTTSVTLPFVKQLNTNGGTLSLVQHDQARAAALKGHGTDAQSGKLNRRFGNVPITNQAVSYIASVGIGSPATKYNLLVDTGSSNTWVGAGTAYKQTKTSIDTGAPVSVSYGSGSFSGTEWLDTVTLNPFLVIRNQSIGVASTSSGMNNGVDGIIGIGPVGLTLDTLSNEPSTPIPTVTDNLYSQWSIFEDLVSVSFEPSTTNDELNGELTFGCTDFTRYTGSISYTPITSTSPASLYWGINQSVAYGNEMILSETAGIVDTGTTLVLLASNAYSAYQSATGATEDATTGLLTLTNSQYENLKDLNFNVGSVTYKLTPNGQIWPRSLNTQIGGTSGLIYSIVSNLGSPSGQGLDFINGQAFLERFYSVYDTGNQRVGFATTPFTDATTN